MNGIGNIVGNIIMKCFSFEGRVNRRQYWVFVLSILVLMLPVIWFAENIPQVPFTACYAALMALPYLSATIKRLHDIGKKGTCLFLGLFPVFGWIMIFLYLIEDGKNQENLFGSETDWSADKLSFIKKKQSTSM